MDFIEICRGGNLKKVKDVLKKVPRNQRITYVNQSDKSFGTALHYASEEGHLEVVKYLIKKGAKVNQVDKNYWAPLHCAAERGHLEVCAFLIDKGAEPEAQTISRTTVLHYLIRCDSLDITPIIKKMLDKGVKIDVTDKYGETALHQAATRNRTKSAECLIDLKADINFQNKFGETPLHKACTFGHLAMVELLIRRGADANIIAEHFGSIREVAIQFGNQDIVTFLDNEIPLLRNTSMKMTSKKLDIFGAMAALEKQSSEPALELLQSYHFDEEDSMIFSSPASNRISEEEEDTTPEVKELNRHRFQTAVTMGSPRTGTLLGSSRTSPLFTSTSQESSWLQMVDTQKMIGFQVENMDDIGVIPTQALYADLFYNEDHVNYVGLIKLETRTEPFAVSLRSNKNECLAILWKREGDEMVTIPSSEVADRTSKQTMNVLKNLVLGPKRKGKGYKVMLHLVTKETESLKQQLLEFEHLDPLKPKCMSIGVLYCKEGQISESEMFGNGNHGNRHFLIIENGSPAFNEFIEILGDKIELLGFGGYRGDLDVKGGSTGRYSVYTRYKDIEIMFHVSTMLPFSNKDPQQLARKSRIGNDLGVIVFQDGNCSYTTPIASQFLHVYTFVTPVEVKGKTHYRLTVAKKDGVPDFPPKITDSMFFERTSKFRDILLSKCINGNLASLRSPGIRSIFFKPKEAFLAGIVGQYHK